MIKNKIKAAGLYRKLGAMSSSTYQEGVTAIAARVMVVQDINVLDDGHENLRNLIDQFNCPLQVMHSTPP